MLDPASVYGFTYNTNEKYITSIEGYFWPQSGDTRIVISINTDNLAKDTCNVYKNNHKYI